jgi:myosin heavy subunit
LLEKSRVVLQLKHERNFHIFYQILNSAYAAKFGLHQASAYHYLNQSGVYEINGEDDAEEFKRTVDCMLNVGFTQEELDQVIQICSALLTLGNITFADAHKSGVGNCGVIAQ